MSMTAGKSPANPAAGVKVGEAEPDGEERAQHHAPGARGPQLSRIRATATRRVELTSVKHQ